MNSNERREARYKRRVAFREKKRNAAVGQYDNFDAVFPFSNIFTSSQLCQRNIGWKKDVQAYKANRILNIFETYNDLHEDKYRSSGFHEFTVVERGRERSVQSISMRDKVVQRCLCDFSLVPIISRSLIYDNGACLKKRGVSFAIKRMEHHLHKHFRKYGNEGYILQYDFSKYFDTLPHDKANEIVDQFVRDEKLNKLTKYIISCFGDVGVGLGSYVAVVIALAAANDIDHYMKEVMRVKCYGRYMDDGYIISHDKEFLHRCLEALQAMCEKSGITLNTKKTHITKLSRGFTFLKIRFCLQKSGKVVKMVSRNNITRVRRRIKKFEKKVDEGKMNFLDAFNSIQSWLSYAKHSHSYRSRVSMVKLFNRLFEKHLIGGTRCLKY